MLKVLSVPYFLGHGVHVHPDYLTDFGTKQILTYLLTYLHCPSVHLSECRVGNPRVWIWKIAEPRRHPRLLVRLVSVDNRLLSPRQRVEQFIKYRLALVGSYESRHQPEPGNTDNVYKMGHKNSPLSKLITIKHSALFFLYKSPCRKWIHKMAAHVQAISKTLSVQLFTRE